MYNCPKYFYNEQPYWSLDELVENFIEADIPAYEVINHEIYSCRPLTITPESLLAYFYDDLDALCELDNDACQPSQSLSTTVVSELKSAYRKVSQEVYEKFWESDIKLTEDEYDDIVKAIINYQK